MNQYLLELENIALSASDLKKNKELNANIIDKINPSNQLKDFFKISNEEAILFSVIFHIAVSDGEISARDVSRFMGYNNMNFIDKLKVLDSLKNKGLILINSENSSYKRFGLRRRNFSLSSIRIELPKDIVVDIINSDNKNILHYQDSEYKRLEVLMKLTDAINDIDNSLLSQGSLLRKITKILDNNKEDEIVKKLYSYNLSEIQLVTIIILIIKTINDDSDYIEVKDIASFISNNIETKMKVFNELSNEAADIYTNNLALLQPGYFSNDIEIRLMPETFIYIIGNDSHSIKSLKKQKVKNKLLHSHEKIKTKKLYYPKAILKEIENVRYSLMQENFNSLRDLFSSTGFSKGLNILLYGPPGTGKTETVLQFARESKRDIYWINLSAIKSAWFGESEKNIKKIFDDYKVLVKNEPNIPILFINEADAILSTRIKVERTVDQVSNSIQNIILQEMEQFEGIMIATSNIAENFDEAFSRRFLFKIELKEPDFNAQINIWKNRFPILKDYECEMLCESFSFTGAVIENIHKKIMLDNFLNNTNTTFTSIMLQCDVEANNYLKAHGLYRAA